MRRESRDGYGAGEGGYFGMRRLGFMDGSARFQGKAAMGITSHIVYQVVEGRGSYCLRNLGLGGRYTIVVTKA